MIKKFLIEILSLKKDYSTKDWVAFLRCTMIYCFGEIIFNLVKFVLIQDSSVLVYKVMVKLNNLFLVFFKYISLYLGRLNCSDSFIVFDTKGVKRNKQI